MSKERWERLKWMGYGAVVGLLFIGGVRRKP